MSGVYLDRLMLAIVLGNLTKGEVLAPEVWHDDGCALFGNRGPCNCDPKITLMLGGAPCEVLADGQVRRSTAH